MLPPFHRADFERSPNTIALTIPSCFGHLHADSRHPNESEGATPASIFAKCCGALDFLPRLN